MEVATEGGGGRRETDVDGKTDRQTDRQTEGQRDRKTDGDILN